MKKIENKREGEESRDHCLTRAAGDSVTRLEDRESEEKNRQLPLFCLKREDKKNKNEFWPEVLGFRCCGSNLL